MTMPEFGVAKILMNPSTSACIFARAFPANGRVTTCAGRAPASRSACVKPTVAISGAVNTFADTIRRSSGDTESPSACHIEIRPCMAATLASASTGVQSPAAYTPWAVVRETRSTLM